MQEVIIMDLEYTSWNGALENNWSAPGQYKEIVQIGAIRIKNSGHFEELDSLSVVIKPTINPVLSDYFTNLTGITNEMLSQAHSLQKGLEVYDAFVRDTPVFCYGDDGAIVAINLEINAISDSFGPLTKVGNLRPWFVSQGIDAYRIPSGELYKALGLSLNGSAHNALHDVRSIAVSVVHLVHKGASNPFL